MLPGTCRMRGAGKVGKGTILISRLWGSRFFPFLTWQHAYTIEQHHATLR